ncbi:hypothetical protein F4778DRAFT_789322 [Xylariomycetidae sp. FL2044]|nr:hypothetical protein F4778DRAFT_789322 [Xylariomycetidae sp. FL2044]
MARLRQFKYFTRLPPEIQRMIWEYSPPPLVHILYGYPSYPSSAFPGASSIVKGVGYAIYSPRAERFLTITEHDTFGIAKERFEQLPVNFALYHNTTPVPVSTSDSAASASASPVSHGPWDIWLTKFKNVALDLRTTHQFPPWCTRHGRQAAGIERLTIIAPKLCPASEAPRAADEHGAPILYQSVGRYWQYWKTGLLLLASSSSSSSPKPKPEILYRGRQDPALPVYLRRIDRALRVFWRGSLPRAGGSRGGNKKKKRYARVLVTADWPSTLPGFRFPEYEDHSVNDTTARARWRFWEDLFELATGRMWE